MVKRGMKPVLAARRREAVEALAAELGGSRRRSRMWRSALDPGAPRTRRHAGHDGRPVRPLGRRALDAAIDAGAHYIDSTGEPPFVRKVFEAGGPRAERSGTVAMTAMGYDWVPGNLTGALALSEAEGAGGVRIGYFATGEGLGGMSGGTRASLMGALIEPSFQFRDGSPGHRARREEDPLVPVGNRQRQGISVGTSRRSRCRASTRA